MRRLTWMLVAITGLTLAMACDDDDGDGTGGDASSSGAGAAGATPCNEDPSICQAGQTCWFFEDSTTFGFTCLNSGTASVGEECQAFIGTPTCADGLMCVMLQGQTTGGCTEWCNPTDPNLACPDGRQCMTVNWTPPSGGDVTSGHVCEPPTTSTGGSGGSGGGLTGGSGGSVGGSGGSVGGTGGVGGTST